MPPAATPPPTLPTITFDVIGLPAPQGSKTAMNIGGKARAVEGSSKTGRAKLKSWRAEVADRAVEALAELDHQYDGPVSVHILFRFPRPSTRPKRHHGWHTVKPDKDKIVRATFDAISASGLWRDDNLAAIGSWAALETDGWTGARITVSAVDWTAAQLAERSAVAYTRPRLTVVEAAA